MAVDPNPYWAKAPSERVMKRLKQIKKLASSIMTVRRITYILNPGKHGKDLERAYNTTIKDVVRARIRRILPWGRIRESRCEFINDKGYSNVERFIEYYEGRELGEWYSLNKRPSHKRKFLVWFEKDTVDPEFKEICGEYDVPLVCGRGQATWTIKRKMSQLLSSKWTVLYCGDNDEKGREICDVIKRDLKYMRCHAKVIWAMVTDEMEEEYNLPSEARLDDFDLDDLKEVLRKIILEYIDEEEYNRRVIQEEREIEYLEKCSVVIERPEE